ncbi:substrate-binding domain-containing protein [Cytophaga aurantiaca]|uniref:substrate-binding domain-containing protein n=1 Tax=Cytophaga aurantiaca TaxID=29530 RepID=UPI0003756EB6|nr:substrate-binding domain-containing protein [Cytophaga aurantiaca]
MKIRCGGVPEHFNYPWHVAIEQGYFAAEGIELEWLDYKGGTGAMCQDLRADIIDIATLLTEGAIADIAKGNPAIIDRVYVASPLIWGIHTGAASHHTNPDKPGPIKYAVSRMGSGSHLMALVDRMQRSLDLTDASWELIQNLDGARVSLQKNESDYFLWEKNMTAPYVYNGELRRIGECPTPWPSVVITISTAALNRIKNVEGMYRALQKAVAFIQQLPDPAQTIAAVYDIKIEDARDWYARIQWGNKESLSKNDFDYTATALVEAGILDTKPSYESVCK